MTAPAEWKSYDLGQLLTLSNGINADKGAYGRGTPFINVLEVISNESLTASVIPGRVTLPRRVLARYQVKRGDVLFNRTSETQDEVGLAAVYLDDSPVVFGGFVFRGRPLTTALDMNYAKYALRASGVREQIVSRGQGGIRANVGQRDLKSVEIRLPDKDEQRAIAEVVDNVSSLISTLERLITKKQAIQQGRMQQLLTGRTRLPGFTDGWSDSELGAVSSVDPDILPAGTDSKAQIDYISLEDVERGQIRGHNRLRFELAPSRARRVIKESDVLFGTVRPNLQSHAIYRGGLERPVASTGFAVVRAAGGRSDPHFLFYLLMSRLTTVQIDRIIAGSNYPAVSSGDVRGLKFAFPPLEEQRAIGAVLADCDAEISALKRRIVKARAVKTGMMQELLTGRTRLPVGREQHE